MIKPIIISCCLVLLFVSCKTVSIQKEAQKKTEYNMSLGSVGLDKELILKNNYNNTAIPNYKNPIKVSVAILSYTK
jgi:hypothetical protein